MRISAFTSPELAGAILLLKNMPRDLAKETRRAVKEIGQPEWQEAVRGGAATALEVRVLADTARIAVSDQNVTLQSAAVGRSLSGGAKPSEIVGPTEFGAGRDQVTTYPATSRLGRPFTVRNRHTTHQFRPRFKKGYVVYQAAARIIPRIAALYVQTTVRTFLERFDA